MLPGEAPVATALAWAAFTLLAVVLPGVAVQRLLRQRVDPALVLPLGLAICAGAYRLSLSPGPGWLFPLALLLLDLTLLRRTRTLSLAEGPRLRGALPPFLACLALLAWTEFPTGRVDATGAFVADGLQAGDAAFHVAVAFELTQGFPPQLPGMSGVPLAYHLGQPLVRAAALRWAGVHPWDSLARFDGPLAALALILALRAAAFALGAGPLGVSLAGWAPLVGDLALPFAAGRGIEWWISLFESSAVVRSLGEANSMIPALAMALACLVALRRAEAGEGRGGYALAALLAVATAFFKIFVAAQLLAGLALAALLARRRAALILTIAPGAAAALALVAEGGGSVAVFADPLRVVAEARQDLGFAALGGAGLLAWTAVWLVAALGLRLAGVPAALRALARGEAPARALAVIALSGWLLGLVFRVSPLDQGPVARPFNEALYFFEQSGVALWVFAALALGRLRLGRAAAAAAIAAGLAAALPTTIQFALHKRRVEPMRLHADGVAAARALAADSQPGDVVIQRPELQRFPPAPFLVGRRLPFTRFIPFYSQFLPREQRLARYRTVRRFFETTDAAEARRIAQELGARWALLYGADALACDTRGWLEPAYEGERARLYRIRPDGGEGP